jgi:ribonuclease HII
MPSPTFARETLARAQRLWPVAGVDEVGRGPLAGPVVAAAVILDPANIPDGLADSKRLTARTREDLCALILESALGVGIASIGAREIDATNIRIATLKAARNAVAALSLRPVLVLIDGRDACDVPCTCEAIVRGDASVASIAAASIVAKVTRDAMLARLDVRWPDYGFARHAGYATAQHREALKHRGPCPEHRFSFAPLKGLHTRGV